MMFSFIKGIFFRDDFKQILKENILRKKPILHTSQITLNIQMMKLIFSSSNLVGLKKKMLRKCGILHF